MHVPNPVFSFATVGMFSAVSNLGAGGTQDVSLSDTANGVLYGMFALTGLISGGINNRTYHIAYIPLSCPHVLAAVLGPRLTLFLVRLLPSYCFSIPHMTSRELWVMPSMLELCGGMLLVHCMII